MKTFFLSLLLCSISLCNAQTYRATFKVIDESSGNSISGANVEIEQLPGVINYTDDEGIVIFRGIPEGRVSVRISARGYVPKIEHYTNISSEEKNNYYPISLVKTAAEQEVLFFGEIIDEDEKDVVGARVEIKILNRTFEAETDKSGNFSIKVPDRILKGASNYKIEVESDCTNKYREQRVIPNVKNIQVDIIIECGQQGVGNEDGDKRARTEPMVWSNSNVKITLVECSQTGRDIICNFKARALNAEMGYTIDLPGTEIHVAPNLHKFDANYVEIGENSTSSGWVGKQIFPGYDVNVRLKFGNAHQNVDKIVSLKIRGWDTILGGYYDARFADVPVE